MPEGKGTYGKKRGRPPIKSAKRKRIDSIKKGLKRIRKKRRK